MAFDRLLLRLWPPSASPHSGDRAYQDTYLARRIGVNRDVLMRWRRGGSVPRLSTLRRIALSLEAEFGVPAEVWMEALAISNYARRYVLARSGVAFIPARGPELPKSGEQFGYWVVLRFMRRRTGDAFRIYAQARCLLCASIHEVNWQSLRRRDRNYSCRPCATRLYRRKGISGLRGVHFRSSRGNWIAVTKGLTGFPDRIFKDPIGAARYYDACMYERYGHTLFLNFPDEYDRSSDPVFMPVGRQNEMS
jgi:transcriptional regulator with XRE-family HTH domain